MDNQSPAFKAIEAEWYKKLKKSGFDDIEMEDGSLAKTRNQKQTYLQSFVQGDLQLPVSHDPQYYRLAGQFLHDHKFQGGENGWEYKIWKMHSEGMSIREIVAEIRTRRAKGMSKDYVQKALKPLIAEMLRLNRESDE